MPRRIIFQRKRLWQPAGSGPLPIYRRGYPAHAQQRIRPEGRGAPAAGLENARNPGRHRAEHARGRRDRNTVSCSTAMISRHRARDARFALPACVRAPDFFSSSHDAPYDPPVVSLCGHRLIRSAIGRRPYAPRRSRRGQSRRKVPLPYKPAASRATGQPTSD